MFSHTDTHHMRPQTRHNTHEFGRTSDFCVHIFSWVCGYFGVSPIVPHMISTWHGDRLEDAHPIQDLSAIILA